MYKNECVPQDENHFSALDIYILTDGWIMLLLEQKYPSLHPWISAPGR